MQHFHPTASNTQIDGNSRLNGYSMNFALDLREHTVSARVRFVVGRRFQIDFCEINLEHFGYFSNQTTANAIDQGDQIRGIFISFRSHSPKSNNWKVFLPLFLLTTFAPSAVVARYIFRFFYSIKTFVSGEVEKRKRRGVKEKKLTKRTCFVTSFSVLRGNRCRRVEFFLPSTFPSTTDDNDDDDISLPEKITRNAHS